jgi:hypothetical protein
VLTLMLQVSALQSALLSGVLRNHPTINIARYLQPTWIGQLSMLNLEMTEDSTQAQPMRPLPPLLSAAHTASHPAPHSSPAPPALQLTG